MNITRPEYDDMQNQAKRIDEAIEADGPYTNSAVYLALKIAMLFFKLFLTAMYNAYGS